MSQPTRGDVHVNAPLTNVAVAFIQKATDFVAAQVFPVVPVAKQSDRYFQYDKKQWRRANAKKRGPSTESAGGGFSIDNTPSYLCDVYAIHMDVSDQLRANQDAPVNLDRDASRWVAQQLLLRQEKLFMSKYFGTSIWTGSVSGSDVTPSTLWDAAGSDPVDDVLAQMDAVHLKTGYRPNRLVVTPDTYRALRNNASIIDRYKHVSGGLDNGKITESILAGLFEVERFIVARAVEDTADEGLAESASFIAGSKRALLVYAAPAPSILEPSGGYIFAWSGLFGAGAMATRVKRFRMEHLESDRVEGEMAVDMKLVAAQCGAFFTGVIS